MVYKKAVGTSADGLLPKNPFIVSPFGNTTGFQQISDAGANFLRRRMASDLLYILGRVDSFIHANRRGLIIQNLGNPHRGSCVVAMAYGSLAAIWPRGQNFSYRSRRMFVYLFGTALCPHLRSPYAEWRQEVHIFPHLVALVQRGAVEESALRVKSIIIYLRRKEGLADSACADTPKSAAHITPHETERHRRHCAPQCALVLVECTAEGSFSF